MLLVKLLVVIACWALGLSCIQKAITFIPAFADKKIPGPPIVVLNSDSIAWLIFWMLMWGITGILLVLVPFFGNKWILYTTPTPETNTNFRLDDLAMLMYAAINITWGLSWYMSYFTDVANGVFSTAYNSGGTLLAPGLFVFSIWAITFTTRAERGEVAY